MGWKLIGMGTAILAGFGVLAILYGSWRWQKETSTLHAAMESAALPLPKKPFDFAELQGLPAPVQRYFRKVLREKQPMVTAVRVHHRGTFNMSENGEAWKPFRSTQHVIVRSSGFLWDARIHAAPALPVFVRDAYVAHQGILKATIWGLFPVMKEPQTPELAHGQLMRFLAEAAWYPTALLPRHGVQWHAVDDSHARAALTDGRTTVALTFAFAEEGWVRSVRAEARHRRVNGRLEATVWEGRFWNYEMRDGLLIPLNAEVSWLLPEGPKPYWRGRIEHIDYQYAL